LKTFKETVGETQYDSSHPLTNTFSQVTSGSKMMLTLGPIGFCILLGVGTLAKSPNLEKKNYLFCHELQILEQTLHSTLNLQVKFGIKLIYYLRNSLFRDFHNKF
jgi:hypothetical protein